MKALSVASVPLSPKILKERLREAIVLQEILATTPDANVMQATEKSGPFTDERPVILSGQRQDVNVVTVRAGPKNATSHEIY